MVLHYQKERKKIETWTNLSFKFLHYFNKYYRYFRLNVLFLLN